ncbi:hypothetical protein DFH62_000773 [Clostridium beijerinckii]|nr:hypothetical protein [Clostridium beijerinckii]NRW87092.1 hypothetical protein [Clostridium beijerinckii]NRY18409.1 hypothetical protein [Clostridium beijerinckii]NRY73507.1 hypothetical protein [Clostridium beijerinckii]NSB78280.1 hypothetical protein [Clostridium beijerinckii]
MNVLKRDELIFYEDNFADELVLIINDINDGK